MTASASDPLDVLSDLTAMATEVHLTGQTLRAALREAGRMTGDGPVVVAYLARDHPTFEFHESMLELWDSSMHASRGGPITGRIAMRSSPRIAEARSQLVDTFLLSGAINRPRTAEWLLMLDDDMDFSPDDVAEVLAVADPVERPIIGGLCFAGMRRENAYPTLYAATVDDQGRPSIGLVAPDRIPDERLIKVGATGAAFLLVHRRVYLAMRKTYALLPDGRPNPYTYFAEGVIGARGEPLGEDTAFCMRARAIGFPIYVATNVDIGHVKVDALTRSKWEALHGAD